MYRIKRAHHHRTGDKWCIYPSYDYTHGQSDSIEGITHSICTLEFENHRPLYDWFCRELGIHHPQQIEFARLNLTYAVMSKRKLLQLVQEKHVAGWDDPRMLTDPRPAPPRLHARVDAGLLRTHRRREVQQHDRHGVARRRDPRRSQRTRAARDGRAAPAEGRAHELSRKAKTIELEAPNHPQKPEMGTRKVPLTREIYIEQEDFMEEAPKKFFRLKPEGEVRLRCAGIIKCDEVVKDAAGKVTELRCTFDPDHSRKVKGTIHWVSAPLRPHRRGAALRSPVRRRESRRRPGGKDVPRQPQPELAGDRQRREARTVAERRQRRARASSSNARLLLRRPRRLEAGQAGVQSHGDACATAGRRKRAKNN